MREILFRGKEIETGRWVKGSLLVFPDGDTYIQEYQGKNYRNEDYFSSRHVETETVGQFTGLHDSTNIPIYEGDILEVNDVSGGTNQRYLVTWGNKSEDYPAFTLDYGKYDDEVNSLQLAVIDQYIEVISNIHENPELLK